MAQETPTKESMIRFLLGDLPADEQEEMEIALLDEEVFDQYLGVEVKLLEKYLAGELSGREAEQLKNNYLMTERGRGQLEAVRAFDRYLDALRETVPAKGTGVVTPEPALARTEGEPLPASWWKGIPPPARRLIYSSVALFIILVGTNAYFFYNWRRQAGLVETLRKSVQRGPAQNERELQELRERNDSLQQQLDSLNSKQNELAAELAESEQRRRQAEEAIRAQANTGRGRGGAVQPLISTVINLFFGGSNRAQDGSSDLGLASNVGSVDFTVNFPPDKGLNNATLVMIRPVGGKSVWSSARRLSIKESGQHRVVTVTGVPARILSTGDYILTLSGTNAQGQPTSLEFPFSVRKE